MRWIHAAPQRGRVPENRTVPDGHLLISVDGTGHHSSQKVRCRTCCVRRSHDGTETCYHQVSGAAVVHPDMKEVFPPAPVRRMDGPAGNDCGRNAAGRFTEDLRREHPHTRAVIVEDGPASNGRHISLLKEKGFRFIPGAEPADHGLLFR
ncbi:MAG: hypothetical protein OXF74_01725 [Rhodobacteraceae bacterium]|nr:hypothetical protein [Paracoccaceae bacterium]